MTSAPAGTVSPVGRRGWRRPTGKALFLGVLVVIEAVYWQMAFDLEWQTVAGRIGPGFFPRIIGGLAIVLTLVTLVLSLRAGAPDAEDDDGPLAGVDATEEDGGGEDLGSGAHGHHPIPVIALVAASFGLLAVFLTLGAIVACALFLLVMLFYLNRRRPVLNVALSLLLPLALYLLFQTFLNAGLPGGILPRF
ncbi:tripartite tricarboxylate transporter TctB family protein [Geodermatophilus sp. YIM 151500]|uniref:tripartite tricarboxylate transporter TctB family protein n=1 Tax=Geodermatophilus sp. YIM 151500 TaxID=2984531 RepID=UPI0021E4C811|nr:tripartite tricarboxylate transporter TctB family protein [Geodermatophilus sp. YIM 151500]MCV2491162.1 tripartite tricarboxylate transporter TctB family protein [Geodermatophilus sp. YIM 151500]